MSISSLRTAVTNASGAPTQWTHVGLLRQLITAWGGTPSYFSVNDLLRQAITTVGGTPTKASETGLLRELVLALNGAPSSFNNDILFAQVATFAGQGTPSVPQRINYPSISGTPTDGQTLTIDSIGSFSGVPTSYAYQWYADAVAISGATSLTRVLAAGQVGKVITAGVIATNAQGPSLEAISNSLGPVAAAAGSAPVNSILPILEGTAREGYTLLLADDVWDGTMTQPNGYQWRRGGSNITGATLQTYTLVSADVGLNIDCTNTATNGFGSTSVTSLAFGPVLAAVAPSFSANPVISGTTSVGAILTCGGGTITADPPATLSYNWKRDGSTIGAPNSANYALALADLGTTITCTLTATNAGGSANATSAGVGPITIDQPILDTSLPAPVLTLAVSATTFPPQFNVKMPAEAKATVHSLQYENATEITFASPTINDTLSISDSEATNKVKLDAAIASVTSGANFSRSRLLYTSASLVYGSAWSPIRGHGDVTAPTLTSGLSYSSNERSPVLQTLTFSEACYVTLAGADAGSIEIVTAQPAASLSFRLLSNAVPDYEDPNYPNHNRVFTVTPVDASGNVGATSTITLSITDIDELATAFTFTDVGSASLSTVYTSNTITIAGLASGVSSPYVVSGGTVSKNGGAYSSSAGTVVNTDTLVVRATSSGSSATAVNVVLTVGDVAVNQVSDTYTVTTTNTFDPTTLFASSEYGFVLNPSDLTKLFQSNAGSTAVTTAGDVVGYFGDATANANHFKTLADDTTRPTYQTTGGAHLLFDGSNDFLGLTVAGLMVAGAATIIVAMKSENTAQTDKHLIGEGSSAANATWNPFGRIHTTAQQRSANIVNNAGTSQLSTSSSTVQPFDGNWNLYMIEDSGSNLKVTKINGGVSTDSGVGTNYTRSGTYTNLNRTGLGGSRSSSVARWFNCRIGRVVAIGRAMTSQEKTDVKTWVAALQSIVLP